MRFSVRWLLALCRLDPDERTAVRFAEALTARGLTVDALEPAGDDHVLDVDIPANRPDCLGHLGLARELAAAFGAPLVEPPGAEPLASEAPWATVAIEAGAACSRYTAGLVQGVRVAPSPGWVVKRLESCGLRSISNVVDVSNLVLLELGHPIHFFDRAKLADAGRASIVVRNARPGERLVTLDGVERVLDADTLVIAADRRAVALAGIIGGAETEIDTETTDVIIEAARFDPRSIRAAARRLDVHTDASFRFERGVDPGTAGAAQALAAHWLAELAGGRPTPGIVDLWPGRGLRRTLELRAAALERLLGYRPEEDRVTAALTALRLEPRAAGPVAWSVTVPSWRIDLEREADLVEEVARHIGYGEIPSIRPATATTLVERAPAAERLRDTLAHAGFHEAFGYSMIAPGEDDRFVREQAPRPLALTNPIAEPMARLRRSILPGLLRAVELNLRRGNSETRLFEAGRVFLAGGAALPLEPAHAALAWCGHGEPWHWSRPARAVDLYDIIGLAEHALEALGHRGERRRSPIGRPAFHPGCAFCWTDGTDDLAWGGALHPELAERFDVPVFALEIDLDAVARRPAARPRYVSVSRFPSVTRDLALVLTAERPFADVLAVLHEVESPAPVVLGVVDRYEGPPLRTGEASVTVRFTLEPRERTLTDPEVEAYRTRLVEALSRRLGVQIRA